MMRLVRYGKLLRGTLWGHARITAFTILSMGERLLVLHNFDGLFVREITRSGGQKCIVEWRRGWKVTCKYGNGEIEFKANLELEVKELVMHVLHMPSASAGRIASGRMPLIGLLGIIGF